MRWFSKLLVVALLCTSAYAQNYGPPGGNSSGITGLANPTATAGPAAINGSATTAMRSDAAPAIQKATSGQFGLVEVDGTTITASGGVITAIGAAATTVTSGVTTVSGGSTSCPLFNSSGGVLTAGCTLPGAITVTGNITASGSGATVISGSGGFYQSSTPMAYSPGGANFFFGGAGNRTLSGTDNNAVGTVAGSQLTTGYANVLNGSEAGLNITTGYNNVGIGMEVLHGGNGTSTFVTGYGNTAIGALSLQGLLSGTYNVALGQGVLNACVSCTGSLGIGTGALSLATGDYNIGIGGSTGASITTGSHNVIIGANGGPGYGIITGSGNTIIAGQGATLSDPTDVIILGDNDPGGAHYRADWGVTNAAGWTLTGSINLPGIANAAGNEILCYDTFGGPVTYETAVAGCVPSSIDLKNPQGLIDTSTALEKVMQLQPAIYTYKDTKTFGSKQYDGLYAQQVCAMDDNLCDYENGEVHNYDKVGLTAYLVAAIKAQQSEIVQLKTKLNSNSKKD